MTKIFLILFLFIQFKSHSQVLLPSADNAFEEGYHFNPEFIKHKNIKRITFEILDKKDFEVAVDKNLVENYEFNLDGLLTKYYYTTILKTIEKEYTSYNRKGKSSVHTETEYIFDTVSTSYLYDNKKLILKRYHDGKNYYESRYYSYSKQGKLTKEVRFKETNNSHNKHIFVLGNQVQLSEDSFQYQKFSNQQLKCIFLNTENRPYKEQIINYDSLGRKLNANEYYTAAAWIRQEQKFEYNANGICSAEINSNANSNFVLRNIYLYDENKELHLERRFKNRELVMEINYVNDKVNHLLNSFIVSTPKGNSLRIVKLKYDFGMIGKEN